MPKGELICDGCGRYESECACNEIEQELRENLLEVLASALSDNDVRPRVEEIFAIIKEAGYIKPPESMEVTELAELLYNFMKVGAQNYSSIKNNIQSFLLANHYTRQPVPPMESKPPQDKVEAIKEILNEYVGFPPVDFDLAISEILKLFPEYDLTRISDEEIKYAISDLLDKWGIKAPSIDAFKFVVREVAQAQLDHDQKIIGGRRKKRKDA